MKDIKQAMQSISELLEAFGKASQQDQSEQLPVTRQQVLAIVKSNVSSSDEATAKYAEACEKYLERVIAEKGLPLAAIMGADTEGKSSSCGRGSSERFQGILPEIKERYHWCIENHRQQAAEYFDHLLQMLRELVDRYLEQTPSTARERASAISEIRREVRSLAKWDALFFTLKAASFPAEIGYVLDRQGGPIAAMWRYSPLDENVDYPVDHDHAHRDSQIYAVRGNWAMEKGLMKVGAAGFLDDIDLPKREIGCMCRIVWLFALRDLPEVMLVHQGD